MHEDHFWWLHALWEKTHQGNEGTVSDGVGRRRPSEVVAGALRRQKAGMTANIPASWLLFFWNKLGVKSSAERERMGKVFR